jgi:Transposase DNA-binding
MILPSLDTTDFGATHFGSAELGDRRRTRRLVATANRILANPGGSLPKMINDPAALDAFYRLVDVPEVEHRTVLEPHRRLTLARMCDCEDVVLLIQDTTVLDYTSITSLHDSLGIVGKGRHCRGYLCHNTLAVAATDRRVIGLANQILFRREEAPAGETRAQRRGREGRESRLWTRASQALPPAPEGKLWVDVCDRGADIFEYIDRKHADGGHYLVRSSHDRWVEVEGSDGEIRRVQLHEFGRTLPRQGTKTVDVPARGQQPARTATLSLSAASVTLIPPRGKRGEHRRERLPAFVVVAREIDPPAGAEAVEWILLTNLEVADLDAIVRMLAWYGARWVVEDFHKAMKTGCGVEDLQFTSTARLEPVLALLSVVAVFLLGLRDAGRRADAETRPSTDLFPAWYGGLLSVWRFGTMRDLTIAEFILALGRLGGHQNRRHDAPPGFLVLWRGWTQLHAMIRGAIAADKMRCGET